MAWERKEGGKTSWWNWLEGKNTQQRGMEEAAENGSESSHSTHASDWKNERINEWMNSPNLCDSNFCLWRLYEAASIPVKIHPTAWIFSSLSPIGWMLILIFYNTGLFEMIIGVLTTCHKQYTWDSSICILLFNRTTLQVCYIPYRCSICAPFVIPQTSTR